ncbi:MAG: hypothetical protein ACTHQM_25840, partial [Thermoanaerobaculia bacterium]
HARGLTKSVTPGGEFALQTSFEYVSETKTKEIAPRSTTTTDLDAWDRPIRVHTSGSGDLDLDREIEYDANGRVKLVREDKSGGWVTTTYEYDELGRQTSVETNGIATVGTATSTTEYKLAQRQLVTRSSGGAFTTSTLDRLGRVKESETLTGAQTSIRAEYAYDFAGNRVFATDTHSATATAFDVHGRAIASRETDGTTTETEYNDLGLPERITRRGREFGEIFAETAFEYTDQGRLERTRTRTNGDTWRVTDAKWDGAGRGTRSTTGNRESTIEFDLAGRARKTATGSTSEAIVSSEITANLDVPGIIYSRERNARYETSLQHNIAGDVTQQKIGPLQWNQTYDSFGNITKANTPNRADTQWTVDARGAVETETLPGGAKNEYRYDASGAQSEYRDPAGEATSSVVDKLGRPLSRSYADGTTESVSWDGSRIERTEDRAGRLQLYRYSDVTGQLLSIDAGGQSEFLDYDDAGRLTSWKTGDTRVEWSDFDYEGRPRRTKQTRYREDGSVLDEFEQEHQYNEFGERTRFSMPMRSGASLSAPWVKWLFQEYDSLGNLTKISRRESLVLGDTLLFTASHRAAGRPDVRTIFTPRSSISREYVYDDETSQLRDVRVKVGTTTVAGTSVEYDGVQVSVSRQLGLASDELTTRFTYDQRSRLLGSMFSSRSQVEPSSSVEGSVEEGNTDADFRFAQTRTSAASTSFEEGVGHKIKSMTRGTDVRQFVHDGPERTDDGSTIYTYDARGRLTTMREKNGITPRRIVFTYSGLNRVVGRRAEYAAINNPRDDRPEDWKLEDRASVIAADGLPADTTFVWDLVTDRLVSVYAAGSNGDPLKQIIHGDAAYDDPLVTVTIDPSTGLPTNLYPIFDEAAAGGLQAVLNIDGEIVARNLPNDAYGADDRTLTGVVIDRIAIKPVVVDTVLQRVDVTLHATEQLSAESLATGARLALVSGTGTVIRTTPVAPSLADAYTVLWSLPAADWEALIANAPESAALSIAATPSLRASAWTPDTPILPPTLEDARLYTSDETPFELRQPLTTLAPLNASTLYELSTLALAPTGDREPLFEQVFTARFQALPCVEPMNGAVYVRERGDAPGSGTVLSPDPLGYVDSGNLYSFAGGDPVKGRDPRGLSAAPLRDGGVFVKNDKTGIRYKVPAKDAREHTLALQDLLMTEGGLSAQKTKDFLQERGLKYTHPWERPVVEKILPKGDNWILNGLIASSGLPPQNRQQEIVQGGLQIAGTVVMITAAKSNLNRGIATTHPVEQPETPLSSYWELEPMKRGEFIEADLAETEYEGWHNWGAENNGYGELIDFTKGEYGVSLKTSNAQTSSVLSKLPNHIDDLSTRGVEIEGRPAQMGLDIRVPKGNEQKFIPLVRYGAERGVRVKVVVYEKIP